MQNYHKDESPLAKVFLSKLEVSPGGVTVAVKDLNVSRVSAGTPIGADSNGLYHVVKTAKIQATGSGTSYKLVKGHNFKVGDILASKAGKGYAIQSINTSNPEYDEVKVGTTLDTLNTGDVVFEGNTSSGSGVTFKYQPKALVGTTFDVLAGDNHLKDAVLRGTVIEKNIANVPFSKEIKDALSHIIFN